MPPIRVLQVMPAMDAGGMETFVMNLYRTVDRDVVQFDFLVHEERACDFDEEISDLGGRLYRVPRFNGANLFHYARLCRKVFEEHPEHRIVHGHIGSSAAVDHTGKGRTYYYRRWNRFCHTGYIKGIRYLRLFLPIRKISRKI